MTQKMDREPLRAMPLWYWVATATLFVTGFWGAVRRRSRQPWEPPSEVELQINPMTCTRIVLPDYKGVSESALWPSVVAAAGVGGLRALTTRYLVAKRMARSVAGGS